MKRVATALLVLVVIASIAPTAVGQSATAVEQSTTVVGQTNSTTTAAQQSSGEAYAGTYVSFAADERAVTDYAVGGETMLDSVRVESQQSAEDGGLLDIGGSLSAVTRIEGSVLGLEAQSETEARVEVGADAGTTLTAHDNDRGIFVVESNESTYVVANLSTGANATAESDSQVSVTTANGTPGTLLVVGAGNVTVNDEGDVTARLGRDGRLVFRAYPDGKDDIDREQERLVAAGTAKAETHVTSEDGEIVVDTISYDDNTTLSANQTAEGAVEIAVNRTTHEGTVVITRVSERVLNIAENLRVAVDGEEAIEAATATQLESAIGSERSRYLVAGSGEASADVLVAVNHFSERTISVSSDAAPAPETTAETETTVESETSGDSEATAETSDEETTTAAMTGSETTADGNDGSIPGFTPSTAVVAVIVAALFARFR